MTDWKPIKQRAREFAAQKGHDIGEFRRNPATPDVRTATCHKCLGCCWIARSPNGFSTGGRLLFHICGTNEAKGVR